MSCGCPIWPSLCDQELKDTRIQSLQDQLWAVEEENKLLKEQLVLFGSPLMVPCDKKRYQTVPVRLQSSDHWAVTAVLC